MNLGLLNCFFFMFFYDSVTKLNISLYEKYSVFKEMFFENMTF